VQWLAISSQLSQNATNPAIEIPSAGKDGTVFGRGVLRYSAMYVKS